MKQITLNIPDNHYAFFLGLVQKLAFAKIEALDIPEEHKAIVREEMEKSSQNPERLLEWDQVQDTIRLN